jgi:hypothetical protein
MFSFLQLISSTLFCDYSLDYFEQWHHHHYHHFRHPRQDDQ